MSTDSRPSSSHAGSQSGGGWTPPSVEHLQALLPQYEVISMLGHGGMGAVYKGRQKSLDRLVAIKILPPGLENSDANFVERFKNEARTMAKLNHPGIVAVHDFGETAEGQLYFIMEYVDGTDVAKMIQSSGKLPQDYALSITAHVCDALAYAHGNGVVHRDIKPANILINMQGQIKVADFGLAKADDPSQSSGLTKTGYAMGTPDYVSPEALIMGSSIDGRADLYAIGVMLYQMLTGEVPRGLFQMPNVRTHGETDPRFDAIISRAMQTDREARYQTAGELRKDLDVILTTPHIKQDASKVIAAVPEQVVQSVPDQRSAAQKPVARGPKSPQPPAAKPSPPKKGSSGMIWVGGSIAAVLAIVGFVFLSGGKKNDNVPVAKITAPAPQKATSAPKPAPADSPSSDGWIDGLAEWLAKVKTEPSSNLKQEGSAWRYKGPHSIQLGPKSVADVAVRLTFREATGSIQLRTQGGLGGNYTAGLAAWGPSGITVDQEGKPRTTLATFKTPAGWDPKASHVMEFRAEGDVLTLSVDGQTLGSVKDATHRAGMINVSPLNSLIEKLEYRVIESSPGTPVTTAKTIELVPLVDVAKDSIVGPWSMKEGALHADRVQKESDELYGIALCTLPYTPPEEYDVEAEFTSHESSQAMLMLPLPVAGTHVECSFFFGNDRERWHSLEQLDKRPPYDPKRNGEAAFRLTEKDFTGRHAAHIEVRRASIKMVVDGVTAVDWKGDLRRFAVSKDYSYFARLNRIIVGRNTRPMTFHRISVRELSKSGSTLPATRAAVETWTDGLAEWWAHTPPDEAAALLAKEPGGSRVLPVPVRKGIFLGRGATRGVLLLRATVRDISDFCALHVRHNSPENYQAVLQKDGSTKIVLTQGPGRELARSAPIPGFDPKKSHELTLKVDMGRLTLRLDGVQVHEVSDNTLRNDGTFYFTGDPGTVIEKLEYR